MEDELTAKEKEALEENEEKEQKNKEAGDGEKEVTEEKAGEAAERKDAVETGDRQGAPLPEGQELEELRAQVLQLLLELEEAREMSQKHEESFHELQGEGRRWYLPSRVDSEMNQDCAGQPFQKQKVTGPRFCPTELHPSTVSKDHAAQLHATHMT